jgi:4-amino-4-deoxy-L-arabinose transferase-like glycosyltransferase
VWTLALAYPVNAGLLAFAVLALFVAAWRRRGELSAGERSLWVLLGAYLIVFAIPSQRSGRYLLPTMPALAVLLALAWERIPRWVFVVSLAAEAVVIALVGLLAQRLQQAVPAAAAAPALWALFAVAAVVILAGVLVPALTRPMALATVFIAYLAFALLLRPLDGPAGQYDARVRASARGRQVWVPFDFIAKEERYRFLLPGADVVGYEEHGAWPADVVKRGPLVVVQVPLHASACAGCTVLGRRLDLRGRQTTAELREILAGRLSPALLVAEVLVETPATGSAADRTAAGAR